MDYLGKDINQFKGTVRQLNYLLANYHVYYQNLRNFHWNVAGENFFDLHDKFEELYEDARVKIDEIAERILTLRHRPVSNFSEYLDMAEVEEAGRIHQDREMVGRILDDHTTLIRNMRSVIEAADQVNDEGTIDMVGGFLENLEKGSWMLDAWMSQQVESAHA
jgi:starvation-inducible DNA-binding protein